LLLQAALIVLPLVAISFTALRGLRQDQAEIRRDANARAISLATDLAARLGPRVSQLLAADRPLEGTVVDIPSPPQWLDHLSPADARRWQQAQDAIYKHRSTVTARNALNNLRLSSTFPDLRANAAFAIRLLDEPFRAGRFVDLAQRYPDARTESGAPLATVALLAAARASRAGPLPEGFLAELTRQVRESPSFLTGQLLDEVQKIADPQLPAVLTPLRQKWSIWQQYIERLRTQPRRSPAQLLNGNYLVLTTPASDARKVAIVSRDAAQNAFARAFSALHTTITIPSAAVSVDFAGQRLPLTELPPRSATNLVAIAGNLTLANSYSFRVMIDADPAALYAGYRNRLWLTSALIVCAALASLIGLAALLRGYHRESALNMLKSNIVSSVSHELRAPLSAVRLMAENLELEKVPDPAQQRQYFRLIGQECRRLTSLVENVLDFSRMESGRKQYVFEPIDLVPLLHHIISVMQPVAAERGVTLEFTPPAHPPQPTWDAPAIQQCLVNLLDNAIKHSPSGSAVILEMEPSETHIRLWVRDRGPGIPPEDHARIFDLFYRRGSELRRETTGAGIGLSIVKHVAEAHGGRVVVESEPGCGSRFALELPYRSAHA
jgi:signal transduction histidine kinase